ncbi:MAG: holo-ACP synthase [Burkholderiales bacterium]|nr:holo-ACP synthase [Burkholderiales bacterium]
MIYGIGTDLVEIARIAAALERFGDRFVERILGPQERARYEARRARSARRGVAFLATRFAAKEAVSKAIGLGLRSPMTWRAVEIVNAPSGRPQVVAHDALAEYLRSRRLRLSVSVTDEQAMAMAFVVAEIIDQDLREGG